MEEETVICIHGFFSHPILMTKLTKELEKEKRTVINWGYPSRERTIEEHAENLIAQLKEVATKKEGQPIHFVTHSMGGLILRAALNHQSCPKEAKMGKAVLLTPPNRGSSFARKLYEMKFFRFLLGRRAGWELMTTPEGEFEKLGQFPPLMPILVIAGDRSLNPLLHSANDGQVAIEETKLLTPHNHVTIHVEHMGIVFDKKAIALTKDFLERDLPFEMAN